MLYMCVYGCICVWVYVLYMCVYECMCMGTNPDMLVIKNYGNPFLNSCHSYDKPI